MRRSLRFTLLIVLVLLIPMLPFLVVGELPGERWLSAGDDDALVLGATGAGLLAADLLVPVPSTVVGTLLGARLGFLPGFAWAWLGVMAGQCIGYAVGRWLFSRLGHDLPQATTLALLFVSRPVPVLAEAVTFAAGATGMPFHRFLAVAAVGNGLTMAALAGNGAALLPGALAGPGLVLPLALPVVAWAAWRLKARRSGDIPAANPSDPAA